MIGVLIICGYTVMDIEFGKNSFVLGLSKE